MTGPPLVTGATGFAGSHLVDHLRRRGSAVAAWTSRALPAPTTDDDGVGWHTVDLLDREAIAAALSALSPSVIYHCAGLPHVTESWNDPARALQVNVLGTHHLVDALRRGGHGRPVLLVGSALVYRPGDAAIPETHPLTPTSPYGFSKLAQEMLGRRASGFPVFIARPFNHAGPRQKPDFVTSSFAKQIAEIEAGSTAPVLRVGNLTAQRDITDVRDTVRAYRMIVERGRPGRPYNVCSGRAHRIGDLLDMLIGMARVKVRLEEDPARMRPSDTPVLLGDRSRIGDETGWAPQIPIEQTLGDLLDYWRAETTRPAPPAS